MNEKERLWSQRTWLARVRNSATDSICGAAFLVAGDLVVTCVHVLQAAGADGPGDRVDIDFPLVDEARVGATILAEGWWPPTLSSGDTALLKVDTPPTQAQPLPLSGPDYMRGEHFLTYGFPPMYDDGVETAGSVGGPVGKGWVQMEVDSALTVQTGYSGAPVWSLERHAVVALVTNRDSATAGRVAFGVPICELAGKSPQIAKLTTDLDSTVRAKHVERTGIFKAHQPKEYVDVPLLDGEAIVIRQPAARPGTGGQLVLTNQRLLWRPIAVFDTARGFDETPQKSIDALGFVGRQLTKLTESLDAPASELGAHEIVSARAARDRGLFHPPSLVIQLADSSEIELGILDSTWSPNISKSNIVARDRFVSCINRVVRSTADGGP